MKNGVIFFTDPPYGFKKFDDAPEIEINFNGVYRMGNDGKVTAIEKELTRPNGVALSPDERTLYVSQSEPTKAIIMAYSLDAEATSPARSCSRTSPIWSAESAPGLPDGLTVAADGTIFTSAPGRHRGAVEGRQAARPHRRRQADRQLQVRRRRQDALPDVEQHGGAHPAERQGAGF